MKKIIGALLLISILLCSVLALSACGEEYDDNGKKNKDGTVSYEAFGLKFRLPDYFRKTKIYGYSISYYTPDATFDVHIITKEEVEDVENEYEFTFDITVEEYVQFLIDINDYECSYSYDEKYDTASFYLFYSQDNITYYYEYYTILKNESSIYIILMMCEEELYENYEPLFRLWASYLSC